MSLSFCLWFDAVIFRSFSKLQNQLAGWNVLHEMYFTFLFKKTKQNRNSMESKCLPKQTNKKRKISSQQVGAVWDCADLYILETKHALHKYNTEEQAPQARTQLYIFNSRKVHILERENK